MNNSSIANDAIVACLVTIAGAALAWKLAGGLPFIGIDDAAITRSYSENVANGFGYVYNVGGERVEGSTTVLWMLIVSGLYLITSQPETLIITLCGFLAFLALFFAFRVSRLLTERLGGNGHIAVAALAALLLASPGYFLWTVWTMMEVALWSAAVLWLVFLLVRSSGKDDRAVPGTGLFFVAAMLPLIRPEGVAISVGLLFLGILLVPELRRKGLLAVAISLLAFASVTTFRLAYFGQAFPNTFYAKVSSDRMQDLVDGLKYAASFALEAPFAELFLVAWVGAAAWALVRAMSGDGQSRGLLIPAAVTFGFLSLYATLGGDHFALWRFFQPVTPLMPVALSIGLALTLRVASRQFSSVRLLAWPGLAISLTALVVGWLHYYQARFDVTKEFTLVNQGLEYGRYLNTLDPRPSIGVGPAGGIALAYDGYIYDLLGLNWTEMAHANPVKVGMRNHASFDKPTFWKHRPDVLATFNRPCTEAGKQEFWASNDDAFDGLFEDARFRTEFVPVQFTDGDRCWPSFAVPEWLDQVAQNDSIVVLGWDDVALIN